jgi:hypothetical protein
VVTPYAQGYSAEADLYNRLVDIGYEGKRAYKSQGPYDLLMYTKGFRPLLIEVKYYKAMTDKPDSDINSKNIKRLLKKQNTTKLTAKALSTDSYPLFAFKIKGKGYLFYRIDTGERFFTTYKLLETKIKKVLSKLPFT